MEQERESKIITSPQLLLRRFLILFMLHGSVGLFILLIGILSPYGFLEPDVVVAATTLILIGFAGVILCRILPRRMTCMRGISVGELDVILSWMIRCDPLARSHCHQCGHCRYELLVCLEWGAERIGPVPGDDQ